MTVISIEELTSRPLVNVFLRENSDCYMFMAFRSHSEFQSYFFAKLERASSRVVKKRNYLSDFLVKFLDLLLKMTR